MENTELTPEQLESEPQQEYEGKDNHAVEGEEAEAEGTTPTQPSVRAYTDEEVQSILEADGKLDSNRLTPTHKLIQKSFERHTQKVWQEAAEAKKQYEQALSKTQPKDNTGDPKEAYYQRFTQNPMEVLQEISNVMFKLSDIQPYDDNYMEAQKQKAFYQAIKDEFLARRQIETENVRNAELLSTQVKLNITKDIPDFDTKAQALTTFAQEELGFSIEEISRLTNPAITGNLAVKITKAINKFYDAMNANVSAEKKLIKNPPKPLERAGAGATGKASPSLNEAFKRARQTGDWTDVLELKGAI